MALEKLNFLEKAGVISKALPHEKISYISPYHPVAKLDEKDNVTAVRATVNMKQLNKNVKQVKRHTPSIPELAFPLNGMKYFTKLDFNDASNQLEFDSQSRLLMAMSTIWGVYIWNRVNMGLSPAADIFQECIYCLLGDIKGV